LSQCHRRGEFHLCYAYATMNANRMRLQVYSFVPIPGAQQHKRPRRRYEEIERMYKCGWNGCEKAYGTLNHLNAHVTMQSHGQKRTPEGKSFHPFACQCAVNGQWQRVATSRQIEVLYLTPSAPSVYGVLAVRIGAWGRRSHSRIDYTSAISAV
jgi:hypothetical protein